MNAASSHVASLSGDFSHLMSHSSHAKSALHLTPLCSPVRLADQNLLSFGEDELALLVFHLSSFSTVICGIRYGLWLLVVVPINMLLVQSSQSLDKARRI